MSNLHQLSRGITHRNRMRLWVVLCGKGFSTSLPEEGVTVTKVLMKNYSVFGLLLLSSFIYLTNETKQACEGFDFFVCGNKCIHFNKTCRCGTGQRHSQLFTGPGELLDLKEGPFLLDLFPTLFGTGKNNEFNWGKGKICCTPPSGNCIKDNQGKIFRSSQLQRVQRV